MKRLQIKQQEFRGEITAFLSLILILLLSFVGSILQLTSMQVTKSMMQMETGMALQSFFAEYDRKLLDEYDVFARVVRSLSDVESRLQFYGADRGKHEIVSYSLLSDENGQEFYRQAVESVGNGFLDIPVSIEEFPQIELSSFRETLDSLLNSETIREQEMISAFRELRQRSLVSLVLRDTERVSNRATDLQNVASRRILEQGTTALRNQNSLSDKLRFVYYLKTHFSNFTTEDKVHPLAYELEYILEGKAEDQKNLEGIMEKLLLFRMGTNYTYLLANPGKKAEAETIAGVLSTVFSAPIATEVICQGILVLWAYGESILDLRELFLGGKVPIIKTDENWQLQLENAWKLGKDDGMYASGKTEEGIGYEAYLMALLFAQRKEMICMRALDVIEINMDIQTDKSLVSLEIESSGKLQQEIPYWFQASYQYQ